MPRQANLNKYQVPNVFIGGITQDLTTDDVAQFLAQFSPVESFEMPIDPATQEWKGYAKAHLSSEEGIRLLLSLPSHWVKGIHLGVKPWINKKDYLASKDDMNRRKLFVKFHPLMNTGELFNYFSKFGDVESVECKLDPESKKPRHFGFIVFRQEYDAFQASMLGSISTKNQRIWCDLTTPKYIIEKKVKNQLREIDEQSDELHPPKTLENLSNSNLPRSKAAQAQCTQTSLIDSRMAYPPRRTECLSNIASIVFDQAVNPAQRYAPFMLQISLPPQNIYDGDCGPVKKNFETQGLREKGTCAKGLIVNRQTGSVDHHLKPTSKSYPLSSRTCIIDNHSTVYNLLFRLLATR